MSSPSMRIKNFMVSIHPNLSIYGQNRRTKIMKLHGASDDMTIVGLSVRRPQLGLATGDMTT